MELPDWYQPSKADIFQQHFTAYFICNWFNQSSFLTKLNLWVYHVPAITCSSPSLAVQYSIRAATMAFYGIKSGDVTLQTEASKWYGLGMAEQRTELEHLSAYPDEQQLSFTGLLAPLMFSMFETVMLTNPTGWAQHLQAASRMLEMMGPEACQDGVANSLFRSIRVGMIYIVMSWNTTPALASEPWCTIPYKHRPKTIIDILDDILFQFPACYVLRTRWRELTEALDAEADVVQEEFIVMAQDLKSKLDWFWSHYGDHLTGNTTLDSSEFVSIFDALPLTNGSTATFSTPSSFRDTFSAQLTATYNAGCLLICGLLRSTTPMPDSYDEEINIHGQSILSIADYHEQSGPSHTGCISMIFPLRALIMEARSDDQWKAAQRAIVTWGKQRGVVKLCNLQMSRDGGDKRRMPFEFKRPLSGYAASSSS
ncbi:MAG: hypothetical protein Q9218_003675 [Villophora microphyllina]